MSDFVLSVAMRFLFADAVSACRSVYFADDGSIVTTLSRVDPVVVATGTDLEGMTVSGIAIHATPGAVPTRVDDRLEASAAIDTRHRGDHVECSDRAIRTRRVICPCLGTIGMMIVKNYVAPSRIHGVGLFSGEDIQCDQKIFVVNDRIDIVMSKNAMQAYGPEFVRFMVIFAWEDFHSHDMCISVDNSRFMNHSSDPNTQWNREYGWATRFIAKDEEITCDYHTFWCNAPFADPRE